MMRSCILGLLLLALGGGVFADQTVINVTYSNRQIPHGTPPDTTIVEGSIIATFTSNNPIELLEPDSSITMIDDTTYTYTFVWNWIGSKTVDFIDAMGETLTVEAWPEPVFDFDPTEHPLRLGCKMGWGGARI